MDNPTTHGMKPSSNISDRSALRHRGMSSNVKTGAETASDLELQGLKNANKVEQEIVPKLLIENKDKENKRLIYLGLALILFILIGVLFRGSSDSIPITAADLDADILIVGAGLSGSVIAHLHAVLLNKRSVIIEKRDHLGGNLYDYVNDYGIRTSKYGAHLFHTNNERVWRFVQQFTEWTPYFHRVVGRVDGKVVPIPVNIDTVNQLLGENVTSVAEMKQWLDENQVHNDNPQNGKEAAQSRVGEKLYNLIFRDYTFKQWSRYPEDLAASVLNRIPVRDDWDDRYFPADPFQALPSNGYTPFMETMIRHPLIKSFINVDFFKLRESGILDESKYEKIFFTGPIDAYFYKSGLPKLEYRSINFETISFKNMDYYGPASVVNNPQPPETYTRHVEYKHLFDQHGSHTTIVRERSTDKGDPYYPVPNKRNQDLYHQYQEMAQKEEATKKVYFVGRLASYKYFNMDQAILNAIHSFEKIYPNIPENVKEKMYGGKTLEDAKSIFNRKHTEPTVNVVLMDCKSTDIKNFVKQHGCDRMRIWTYNHHCSGIPAECEVTEKSTKEHPFLHFVLSQTWNFADINIFLHDTHNLEQVATVLKTLPSKLDTYSCFDVLQTDVRGTNHFFSLETCASQQSSDSEYCDNFKKEFRVEYCKRSPVQSWGATNAGLRRMLSRHRTLLYDQVREHPSEWFDNLVPFLFNGIDHECLPFS